MKKLADGYIQDLAMLLSATRSAEFARDFPAGGTFQMREHRDRHYSYHQEAASPEGIDRPRYVGAYPNPAIEELISRHATMELDEEGRIELLARLLRAGLPSPTDMKVGLSMPCLEQACFD